MPKRTSRRTRRGEFDVKAFHDVPERPRITDTKERSKICADCIADIFYCFIFRRALGPAAWKGGAIDGVAFFGFVEYDRISQAHDASLTRRRARSHLRFAWQESLTDTKEHSGKFFV